MRSYKVVPLRQKSMLKGRLTPEQLEGKLNEQASEGWIFDRALSGETLLLGKDTFMLVFYREGDSG